MADGPASRERAVLDSAHTGDIRGAFGTIREHEETHRSARSRLLALLAIVGPGLIVMVGDNDAGGVATYSQAGQNYGTSLLWVLLLLVPVLIVNQEMVVRLGAVTGVGHARLILERFGRFWGWFSVIDLFVLNFLTVVTEFIGVSLALGYFGVSPYVAVPLAAVALVADYLIWRDGTQMPLSDGQPNKSFEEMLRHGSILDQIRLPYPAGVSAAALVPPRRSRPYPELRLLRQDVRRLLEGRSDPTACAGGLAAAQLGPCGPGDIGQRRRRAPG